MPSALDRVAAVLDRHRVAAGAPVAVACSGGADSTALADLTMTLSARGRLGPVTLVYLDHGLRPSTAADRAWVAELAERGGARLVTEALEVARAGGSLEAAARVARYRALDRIAGALSVAWVLLAHTASDQAETVLMRILRGSGVVGLAAIPARRGRYLRPLLGLTRAEILDHLAARGLSHVHDETNDSDDFLRNRIRHHLLPALEAENPEIAAGLCRLAEAAAEQRQALDFAAEQLVATATRAAAEAGARPGLAPAAVLDVASLDRAPAPVIKRALAMAAERAGGEPLEARHQRLLLDLVGRDSAGTVRLDLPRLTVFREYGWLRLEPPGAARQARPRLEVRGPDGPYRVREWQPGDRMRPERLGGRSRKLSDLFGDAKIPRRHRMDAAVVVRQTDGVIVWAEYVGAAFGSGVEVTLTRPDPMTRTSDNPLPKRAILRESGTRQD